MDQPTIQTPQADVPKARASGWKSLKGWQKVITVIVIVIILFVFYVILDANKYRAVVHVIEGEGKVGVNPTERALDFGDLSRGTSAVRTVTLSNGTFMPVYVFMIKTGDIASLMKIDKNSFRVKPYETTKIEYSVYMPASAKIDATYKGRVYLFKIPTLGL